MIELFIRQAKILATIYIFVIHCALGTAPKSWFAKRGRCKLTGVTQLVYIAIYKENGRNF